MCVCALYFTAIDYTVLYVRHGQWYKQISRAVLKCPLAGIAESSIHVHTIKSAFRSATSSWPLISWALNWSEYWPKLISSNHSQTCSMFHVFASVNSKKKQESYYTFQRQNAKENFHSHHQMNLTLWCYIWRTIANYCRDPTFLHSTVKGRR